MTCKYCDTAGRCTYACQSVERASSDDADPFTVLVELRRCAMAWEPHARLVGNVRAGDIDRAITAVLPQIAQRQEQ